jgi:hypothetical protein
MDHVQLESNMNNTPIFAPVGLWMVLAGLLIFAGHSSPIPACIISLAIVLVMSAGGMLGGSRL